jgi:hypothetical protein
MRISLVALLALLGCGPVFTGAAMAEQGLRAHTLVLDTFNSDDEEESEEESESCSACYPLPE